MGVWFQGTSEIDCNLETVVASTANLGDHYLGAVSLMSGLGSVELIDSGDDFVTIRTNEGLMRRTGMTRTVEPDSVSIEFDEEYAAGNRVTTNAHFLDVFEATATGVRFQTTISDLRASGVLGFIYRRFGARNMGRDFLASNTRHLETLTI